MEKIIQQSNHILNKWLAENNFKCTVKYDDSFSYDYFNQIISYTLFDEADQDALFLEICKSIYPGVADFDDFTISFFHELGHYATEKYVTDKDKELNEEFNLITDPTDEDKLAYFVSFSEWEATTWACNYIRDNKENIKNLLSLLEQVRIDFFEYMKDEALDESI